MNNNFRSENYSVSKKSKAFPSKTAFIRLFEYEMQSLKGYFSPKTFDFQEGSGAIIRISIPQE